MIIKLSRDKETIIDDTDWERVSEYTWWCDSKGYAVTEVKGKTILLHRVLLNAPKGLDVDHKNHNTLDNRRSNIRLATRSQNRANTLRVKRKYPELPIGISYNPSLRGKQPFMARVMCMGKSYFCGNHYTLPEAVKAYKIKKKELFGDFA